MIGLMFGIIVPLFGVWVTTRVLSAAAEGEDNPRP